MNEKLTLEEIAFVIETSANLTKELKQIKEQHSQISEIFSGVINLQPTAIWLLNEDKSVYLQNSKSMQISLDLQSLDLSQDEFELEINSKDYIFQIAKIKDKTIIAATDNTKIKRNSRLVSMGKMAAHLAHEIRNPIGSVSILASMIFDRVSVKEKPIILEMKKAIWRIERIVKATLLFSKGVTINSKDFLISDFQAEITAATENYSYSKDVEFEFNLPSLKICADFDLLCIVLVNLVINAIDAIEENEEKQGKISVLHAKKNNMHEIKVLDNGLDFVNTSTIFEAFMSTKVKGHGLGLALSKQIIEAHKGEIDFSLNPKGFVILLP